LFFGDPTKKDITSKKVEGETNIALKLACSPLRRENGFDVDGMK